MSDFAAMRRNMIDGQLFPNRVTDRPVLAAFEKVPRERFVPDQARARAYLDEHLHLGGERYLLAPLVFARMVQEARIRFDDVVLDVGTATGYSAAVLGHLASAVIALESDESLAVQAEEALTELGADNAAVVQGPLSGGWPPGGPYDIVLIQGAVPEPPEELIAQLGPQGRLLAVESQPGAPGRVVLVEATNGNPVKRDLFDASVPPLAAFARPATFRF